MSEGVGGDIVGGPAGTDTLVCQGCGAQAEPADRWRWSIATDDRGVTTTWCVTCARDRSRSIEAQLDDDW